MAIATRPKPPRHHKKTVGKHHKATKGYLKTYWPYIPLGLIVGIGLAANSLLLSSAKVLGAQTSISVDGLFVDTNQQRATNGEASLNLNSQLDNAAQAKANDMVTRDYWSHNTPDGQTPWTFITAAGYSYSAAGENLAYGFSTSDEVITAWMNSPEHRANILNAGYKDVGFGIADSQNYQNSGPETVVVAMYATPAGNTVAISFTVPQHSAPAPAPAPTTEAPAPTPTPTPAATAAPVSQPAASNPAKQSTVLPPSRSVARVQLWTNSNALSLFAVSTIGTIAALMFLVRHARAWHRVAVKSEAFVVRHVWLDMLIVSLAMASYILSRAAGVIG